MTNYLDSSNTILDMNMPHTADINWGVTVILNATE